MEFGGFCVLSGCLGYFGVILGTFWGFWCVTAGFGVCLIVFWYFGTFVGLGFRLFFLGLGFGCL